MPSGIVGAAGPLAAGFALAAMHLRRVQSQEAGMKYFVLGAFSSAFFLYGIALVYGAAGTTNLLDIAALLWIITTSLVTFAVIGFAAVLIIVGIGSFVGSIAGYVGGWVDNALMRFVDIVLTLPILFIILMIVGFFGQGNRAVVIIAIGIVQKKRAQKSKKNYLLGGNQLPWYMLGLSNASGMFDITGTMWLVYLIFVYGLKGVFIPWAWPVFNQIFLMVFLSVWLRRSNH